MISPQTLGSYLRHYCPAFRAKEPRTEEGRQPPARPRECARCFTCSSHRSKKGKFKGNWTRSFKRGCSRSKVFHEYPSGSVHMDSRRDPAVLLLIKTVVITFPTLLEQGLCGAAAWRAENVFSRLTGSTPPSHGGGPRPAPPGGEGRRAWVSSGHIASHTSGTHKKIKIHGTPSTNACYQHLPGN